MFVQSKYSWQLLCLISLIGIGCAVDAPPEVNPPMGEPGTMPPVTAPPPGPDICDTPQSPGRVTIHRLNRYEYNATVRDLLDDVSMPAKDFPSDDHGYGFDNNADVLSMSPLLFEKYDITAGNLTQTALLAPATAMSVRAEAELLEGTVGRAGTSAWTLWSNGEVGLSHTFPHDGRYRLSIRAWQNAAGPDDAHQGRAHRGRRRLHGHLVHKDHYMSITYHHTLRR